MVNKKIPVCEPLLLGNERKYVDEALDSGWISSAGKFVEAFEKEFANYCRSSYAVGVTNGTTALHLAIRALGIGKGDEVIVPNFTMISSALAVCYAGAIPVFVDADPQTWNIDSQKIEEKITNKTKAIMVVHIFGLPCDMDAIAAIAEKHKLPIIEDAAEAHGATYDGHVVGSISTISCFSFYANKNITCGEGGMVVTNEKDLYYKCRYYKNLCFPLDAPRIYWHCDIGYNYRLSNLHAAIGLAQLEKADIYKEMRQRNGRMYREFLSALPGIEFQQDRAPISGKGVENVNWMNAITVDKTKYGRGRNELMEFLNDNNVETRPFFIGMNKQPSLINYGLDQSSERFPVTERLSNEGFYLPSGSGLTEEQIRYVCELISRFYKG